MPSRGRCCAGEFLLKIMGRNVVETAAASSRRPRADRMMEQTTLADLATICLKRFEAPLSQPASSWQLATTKRCLSTSSCSCVLTQMEIAYCGEEHVAQVGWSSGVPPNKRTVDAPDSQASLGLLERIAMFH